MTLPERIAYLRDRMLAEEVLAARSATPEDGAVHRLLAERYRRLLERRRRAGRRMRLPLPDRAARR